MVFLVLLLSLLLPAASFAQVNIAPGADIQAAIDGNGAGTTYVLQAGTHRITAGISPKTGDTIQGELSGPTRLTTLSGARLLTSWTADSGRWYASGQTQDFTDGEALDCLATHPMCVEPEDVWFTCAGTLVLKYHEDALADVGAGEWFFDYAADRIYVGDDPTSCTVETSVTMAVFDVDAGVTGVTIRDIIVEKFASATGSGNISGAVNLGNSALGSTGWTADNVEARYNHYAGIGMDTDSTLRNSYVHHNCNSGILGAGVDVLVEDNELAYNGMLPLTSDASSTANACGFNEYWGAGATKFVFTTDLIVQGNYSHDNWGSGLWTDIENYGCTFAGNIIYANRRGGIFHEISHECAITSNEITGNGLDDQFGFFPINGCIDIVSSDDVTISGNICRNNLNGITLWDDNRNESADFDGAGTMWPVPLLVANVVVTGNLIIQEDISAAGGMVAGLVDDEGDGFTGAGNVFSMNTYCLGGGALPSTPFVWDEDNKSASEWQSDPGFDVGSVFDACESDGGPHVTLFRIRIR